MANGPRIYISGLNILAEGQPTLTVYLAGIQILATDDERPEPETEDQPGPRLLLGINI